MNTNRIVPSEWQEWKTARDKARKEVIYPIQFCFYCGRKMKARVDKNFIQDPVVTYYCPAWWLFHSPDSYRRLASGEWHYIPEEYIP